MGLMPIRRADFTRPRSLSPTILPAPPWRLIPPPHDQSCRHGDAHVRHRGRRAASKYSGRYLQRQQPGRYSGFVHRPSTGGWQYDDRHGHRVGRHVRGRRRPHLYGRRQRTGQRDTDPHRRPGAVDRQRHGCHVAAATPDGDRGRTDVAASASESFTAAALFSASDADNAPILQYAVEDQNVGASQGSWVLNGQVLPNGQVTTLSASQLSQLSYVAGSGSTPITDTLLVAASDAGGFGSFTSITVTASAQHRRRRRR